VPPPLPQAQPPHPLPYAPQPGPQALPYQTAMPPGYVYGHVPCPRCGDHRHKPVGFTWWGGVLGPKLMHHVRCLTCATAYNGRSGRYNTTGIVIYTIVGAIIGLALAVFLLYQSMGR
jgi:hypothetical protein